MRSATHPYFELERPVVLGHRGAAAHRPENTLASFAHALEVGAAILESDVQVTRDGVPVLCHDPDLDRTTNGHGPIAALDFAELRALDAGYHYTAPDAPGHFPERGRGHRIPSLSEAFDAFPGARFNLEIKAAAPGLALRVLDEIAEHDRSERTLVVADRDAALDALESALATHRARPARGASLRDILRFVESAVADTAPAIPAMALQVPADFAGQPLVNERFIAHAHAHDIEVHVWTINDPSEMDALLELGVDGLVSDYPDRARQRIAARA